MTSTRIFVRGLPYDVTDAEFKKHFHGPSNITDVKVIPQRRIGFVGYNSAEDAQKAAKYFNKTFIRTSRLSVELATPIAQAEVKDPDVTFDNGASREGTEADNGRKRKWEEEKPVKDDAKLQEFMQLSRSKKNKSAGDALNADDIQPTEQPVATKAVDDSGAQSDDEYEEIPSRSHKRRVSPDIPTRHSAEVEQPTVEETSGGDAPDKTGGGVSDKDWLRSKMLPAAIVEVPASTKKQSSHTNEELSRTKEELTELPHEDEVRSTMRLFLRNLSHSITDADLTSAFESYGNLEEVHVVRDKLKGTAYVQFSDPDSAEAALHGMDGQVLLGRLLHVLPAKSKRGQLDDFAMSKLPLKKQREIQKKREAVKTFNWNALYMNTDAVVSSIADRFGLAKSDVLDPTSSDAAVKQAYAETRIIQETRNYFLEHNIDLNSFKSKQRGEIALLIKNIPYDGRHEVRRLFEEHGVLKNFLMPPAGTIAIVVYTNEAHAQAAFASLNRKRLKSSMLYLEKAPKELFTSSTSNSQNIAGDPAPVVDKATLHVGNLNFTTTSQRLVETFKPLTGFLSAVVKTRTDPKRPNEVLSNGYGFVEFRTAQDAQAAMATMSGYQLEDHKLEIKASSRGSNASRDGKRGGTNAACRKTKIQIRNLDFAVTKKDVRNLFGAYGQLRSVRVPRKSDNSIRGFGFAEFTTPKEAQNAMDALKDTHLLSRRLVLEFADEEPENPEAEILKMQQKVGSQTNKVALQQLTSGGRKKFTTQNEDE